MPRKLKPACSSPEEAQSHARMLALIGRAQTDPLPQTPKMLRAAMRALLQRIELNNPAEGKYVRELVQYLTAVEADSDLAIDAPSTESAALFTLNSIVTGRPLKTTHGVGKLKKQRDLFIHYLGVHPYPVQTLGERWAWVETHWRGKPCRCQDGTESHPLVSLLTSIPCCNYQCELGPKYKEKTTVRVAPNQLNSLNVEECRTDLELMLLILAHLHNTTSAQIQRLLSHA